MAILADDDVIVTDDAHLRTDAGDRPGHLDIGL